MSLGPAPYLWAIAAVSAVLPWAPTYGSSVAETSQIEASILDNSPASNSSAASNETPAKQNKASANEQSTDVKNELSTKSDAELTALTARWGELTPNQRRSLLAEVRGRMAQNQIARMQRPAQLRRSLDASAAKRGVVIQRRYGRVVRKRDGSVVVETRVVRVRPRQPQAAGVRQRTVTFGIGFERRQKAEVIGPVDTANEDPTVPMVKEAQPDELPVEVPSSITISQQKSSANQ